MCQKQTGIKVKDRDIHRPTSKNQVWLLDGEDIDLYFYDSIKKYFMYHTCTPMFVFAQLKPITTDAVITIV